MFEFRNLSIVHNISITILTGQIKNVFENLVLLYSFPPIENIFMDTTNTTKNR